MSGHEATPRRVPNRWLWTYGGCYDCDWTSPQRYNDRSGVQAAVDRHVAETSECTCLYAVGDVVEFDPAGPCAHCRAVAS